MVHATFLRPIKLTQAAEEVLVARITKKRTSFNRIN
jgi:hypothetical protein